MLKATFHLKTFGCQMNVYDSSRIVELLNSFGMKEVEDEANADVIVLNTCYIREKASAKIFSELGRLYKLYDVAGKRQPVFAVLGCVAKAEGENIFRRAPYVSIVLSSQKYHLLPELIANALHDVELVSKEKEEERKAKKEMKKKYKLSHTMNTELSGLEKFDCLPQSTKSDKVAFVQVQEGCDNFCTYCVVPNTRGREVSRSEESILAEIDNLQRLGAVEVNLLGQNVDCYNGIGEDGKPSSLAHLIKKVAKFDNIKRIRYTTSYPSKFSDEMIELHRVEPKLMPLVYLPIQAGSNEVLHKMNRKYTREQYLEIIQKLKNANPNIQISSDFIVGFPNETEEDFEKTLDIVRRVKFIQCYAFKYSPRPNTVAAKMEGQIDNKVKADRLRRLQSELRKSQDEFNKSCVGRVMSVLFSDVSKTNLKYIIGKNEYLQPVIVPADASIIGTIRDVEIESASYANLKGKLV